MCLIRRPLRRRLPSLVSILAALSVAGCVFDKGGLSAGLPGDSGPERDGPLVPDGPRPDALPPDTLRPDTTVDTDGDGVNDGKDNCLTIKNADQQDTDLDGVGDACDNCPTVKNADQKDADGDTFGDVCDNCPAVKNADQNDGDGDKVGDACDNCKQQQNADQKDTDTDNVGDVCDNCPADKNSDQKDADSDTVGDLCDNCDQTPNTDQANQDGDLDGDVCDDDIDGDGLKNGDDPAPTIVNSPIYITEPGPGFGDYLAVPGWLASQDQLCTTDETETFRRVRLNPTAVPTLPADQMIQARVSVSALGTATGTLWQAAGVTARVDTLNPFAAYSCVIDLKGKRLRLIRSTSTGYFLLQESPSGSVPWQTATLRLTAKSTGLTCEIVNTNIKLLAVDSTLTTGTVGFFTFLAKACFDQLTVTNVP
jgi:hypothetical protein